MEPKLDQYIQFSPYNYSYLMPLILKDINGLEVIIHGDDAQNAYNNLKESMTNISLKMNDNGKLGYEGTAITEQEIMLVEAIDNTNIKVNLNTVKGNYIDGRPFAVGSYYGSTFEEGKLNTDQFFNIEHARIWNEAGGSSIGKSVLHEILESYIGGKLFPRQYGYNEENFKKAHSETVDLEKPKEYYPLVKYYFKTTRIGVIHEKTTLKNTLKNKEYLLYENEAAK